MHRIHLRYVSTIFAYLVLHSLSAAAINLDLLLMPGKVIEGHAEYEEDCHLCHQKLKKESQDKKCLGCHDHSNISEDLSRHKGFHGKTEKIRKQPCKHCHTDHQGRDAKIVHIDTETFDHRATDYEIKGAHLTVACAGCHRKGEKFSQAPGQCIDCHEQDDHHKTQLGVKCSDCHTDTAWKEFKFDHAKESEFDLIGKHRQVNCSLCHPGQRYTKTPNKCVSCHKINDSHAGQYGEECDTCHTSQGWSEIHFDHDSETKFRITGKHRKARCDSCHKTGLYKNKSDPQCKSCHLLDDTHKGKNGTDCRECHSTEGWEKISFEHNKDTKFTLAGKHKELVCEACHRNTESKQSLDTQCISCHLDDDVHSRGAGQKCQQCHDQASWNKNIFFDHGLTNFPLLGQHATASCEECHMSAVFKDTSSTCEECHQDNDVHEGHLGNHCAECHNPNDWQLWLFDHDARTEFILNGKHQGLDCLACHQETLTRNKKPETQCYFCHQDSDIHEGGYGNNCSRCHTTESFSEITLMRKP